ncbi:subtilisin-like protein [Hypoxylon sp. FL1150]|nr:subtilisin-like protein [Hypoxylon sp. FL1150]
MRVQHALLPLLGEALVQIASSAAVHNSNDAVAAAPIVPGAYIVELHDDQDIDSFYGDLAAANVEAEKRLDLSYSLFKGLSFRLKNVSQNDSDVAAQMISDMPKVRKVWPIRVRNVPEDEVVWVGNGADASVALKRRQESANDTFSPHVMTQVDKLRAEGFTGTGVRIGIVDTGVDYNHPALGDGCFGPGCLFSYGADLVGDDFTGLNVPVPDPDPYDNCAGHGTHVSGIIAAQVNGLGFTGAAPDATLGMYRVFGCAGSSSDDVLIAAFNQAYEDGSDIITSSIGGPSGWSEDPWAVAVQRIVETGVPCTVSAGNDGSNGLFFASSSANGKGVTAVASISNTEIPQLLVSATFSVDNSSEEVFGWEVGNPSYTNVSLPLWAVSNNTEVEDDACSALSEDTPDLSEYMVLIRQANNCAVYQQAQNVADKGARNIMLYSNGPTTTLVYVSFLPEILGAGMVTATQGVEWIDLLNEGREITLHMTDQNHADKLLESSPDTQYGGLLSSFSSWGPTWEVDVKPQFASPGGNILSTYPLDLGGYAVLSGTSMACPLTAAIYALVSQARDTLDPSVLERLVSSTAIPKIWAEDASGRLAPVPQQGGGLIQAFDAAHTKTIPSVASISFNDTANFIPSANFSIQNLGSDDVTYEIGHVAAITVYTFNRDSIYPSFYPNPTDDAFATLDFSELKVVVPAGGSVDITVAPTPPSGLNETLLPVYSGYITINGTNGDTLSIPYLGVVGSMYSAPKMLDPDWTFLSNYTDPLHAALENTTFSVPLPANATDEPDASIGYPTAVIQLNAGTPLLRCDVVPLDDPAIVTTTEVLGVKIVGSALNYPIEYSQRTYYISPFTGLLANGGAVPEGRYQLLVRILRIFGDPEDEDDYESMTLAPFNIVYA